MPGKAGTIRSASMAAICCSWSSVMSPVCGKTRRHGQVQAQHVGLGLLVKIAEARGEAVRDPLELTPPDLWPSDGNREAALKAHSPQQSGSVPGKARGSACLHQSRSEQQGEMHYGRHGTACTTNLQSHAPRNACMTHHTQLHCPQGLPRLQRD